MANKAPLWIRKVRKVEPLDVFSWLIVAGAGFAVYRVVHAIAPSGTDTGTRPPTTNVTPVPLDQSATLTDAQAMAIADAVYTALFGDGSFWHGYFGEDEAAAMSALGNAANDADLALIAQAYGVRSSFWGGTFNLWSALSTYLSASDISALNASWSARGISFRL